MKHGFLCVIFFNFLFLKYVSKYEVQLIIFLLNYYNFLVQNWDYLIVQPSLSEDHNSLTEVCYFQRDRARGFWHVGTSQDVSLTLL